MTAPGEHTYSSTTHAPGEGSSGVPPLSGFEAPNIHLDAPGPAADTGPGHAEGYTQSEHQ